MQFKYKIWYNLVVSYSGVIKMAKSKKSKKGFFILLLGVFFLIITLLINRYVDIDDVFCVILMTFSLIIEVYGLFIIIKDTYN